MFKDDSVRIRHILDAAREAIGFAEGRNRADLDTDRKLNLSLVRLLEIIGEAARGISQEFRDSHPDLPWNKMVGMRETALSTDISMLISMWCGKQSLKTCRDLLTNSKRLWPIKAEFALLYERRRTNLAGLWPGSLGCARDRF